MTKPTAHTLYRFFDADGVLLYVGRTTAPARRWREHEKGKSWFNDVATVTREVFATAEAVDAAERTAIANEKPLHNIMLNGSRPRPTRPKFDASGLSDTLRARWLSVTESVADENGRVDVDLHLECDGDLTCCECPTCHDERMSEVEALAEEYQWHPQIVADIEAVKRSYFTGHDLVDWFYDLGDISIFWRMRLVTESKTRPIPALTSFDESIATVGCPFCLNCHRHFVASGASLDEPMPAGCADMGGGRYVLVDDFDQFAQLLDAWPSKARAA